MTSLPSESPSGPPGTVKVVEFVLFGQSFMAMSAGPLDPFNHAISLVVNADDQAELDRYWNALLADGGTTEACGWLKDRFGVSWQVVPTIFGDMMADPDRVRAKRVTDAMMKMVKFDIAALKKAYAGAWNDRGTSLFRQLLNPPASSKLKRPSAIARIHAQVRASPPNEKR